MEDLFKILKCDRHCDARIWNEWISEKNVSNGNFKRPGNTRWHVACHAIQSPNPSALRWFKHLGKTKFNLRQMMLLNTSTLLIQMSNGAVPTITKSWTLNFNGTHHSSMSGGIPNPLVTAHTVRSIQCPVLPHRFHNPQAPRFHLANDAVTLRMVCEKKSLLSLTCLTPH